MLKHGDVEPTLRKSQYYALPYMPAMVSGIPEEDRVSVKPSFFVDPLVSQCIPEGGLAGRIPYGVECTRLLLLGRAHAVRIPLTALTEIEYLLRTVGLESCHYLRETDQPLGDGKPHFAACAPEASALGLLRLHLCCTNIVGRPASHDLPPTKQVFRLSELWEQQRGRGHHETQVE